VDLLKQGNRAFRPPHLEGERTLLRLSLWKTPLKKWYYSERKGLRMIRRGKGDGKKKKFPKGGEKKLWHLGRGGEVHYPI